MNPLPRSWICHWHNINHINGIYVILTTLITIYLMYNKKTKHSFWDMCWTSKLQFPLLCERLLVTDPKKWKSENFSDHKTQSILYHFNVDLVLWWIHSKPDFDRFAELWLAAKHWRITIRVTRQRDTASGAGGSVGRAATMSVCLSVTLRCGWCK